MPRPKLHGSIFFCGINFSRDEKWETLSSGEIFSLIQTWSSNHLKRISRRCKGPYTREMAPSRITKHITHTLFFRPPHSRVYHQLIKKISDNLSHFKEIMGNFWFIFGLLMSFLSYFTLIFVPFWSHFSPKKGPKMIQKWSREHQKGYIFYFIEYQHATFN